MLPLEFKQITLKNVIKKGLLTFNIVILWSYVQMASQTVCLISELHILAIHALLL